MNNIFNLKDIFKTKKVKNKNGAKPRKIDETIEKTSKSLSSKFALVSRMEIKAWKAYVALFFVAGIATAILFTVHFNMQTKSAAKSTQLSPAEELVQIRNAIKTKHAKWVAKDNPILRLSLEEKKKRVNAKVPSATEVQQNFSAPSSGITPPGIFDWRNNNGNYVTSVKNQGGCGSCWAFGSTAALESYTLIKNNKPGTDLDLSEQTTLDCSGGGSCEGGYPGPASSFFQSTGIPEESCFPYTGSDQYCSNACANWQASAYKIGAWSYITTVSTASALSVMKQAIATSGPIVSEFAVYSDFTGYGGGIYSFTSGSLLGYHIVEVVGYDDVGQYFIVKNSWGSGWGESGYFRIAYSEVGGTSQFGMYSIAYTGSPAPPSSDTIPPAAKISTPVNGATVSGTITVTASASDNIGVTKVEIYVDDALHATGTSSPYTYDWDTMKFTGQSTHTLVAKAYDTAGNVGKSSVISVTVSNVLDTTAPTVSMSVPANGGTYSKTLKISATASDNVKVTSMQAMIDGAKVCSSATGTLGCSVNNILRKYPAGTHTVTVIAQDVAGNVGKSATASVTFK